MTDVTRADVLVVGGGIAGVSIADELAGDRDVVLLEAEPTLASHATGRSAAMFLQTYGPADVRAMTAASRAFLTEPPAGFGPVLLPRPLLQLAPAGREALVAELYEQTRGTARDVSLLDGSAVEALVPYLAPGAFTRGLLEPSAQEIDVHALHQGYLHRLRSRGGRVFREAGLASARRHDRGWRVTTADGRVVDTESIVNAAGAWADQVAERAGLDGLGLQPRRRTLFTIDGPPDSDVRTLPLVYDLAERFYLKPEGAGLLCSPVDETPSEPVDARADTLQIARALDDVRAATTLPARSVGHAWAGLRTFAADGNLVIGSDPRARGFFWLAGQGGYGIQTAPAAARLGAALLRGQGMPADLAALDVDASRLAPARLLGR